MSTCQRVQSSTSFPPWIRSGCLEYRHRSMPHEYRIQQTKASWTFCTLYIAQEVEQLKENNGLQRCFVPVALIRELFGIRLRCFHLKNGFLRWEKWMCFCTQLKKVENKGNSILCVFLVSPLTQIWKKKRLHFLGQKCDHPNFENCQVENSCAGHKFEDIPFWLRYHYLWYDVSRISQFNADNMLERWDQIQNLLIPGWILFSLMWFHLHK